MVFNVSISVIMNVIRPAALFTTKEGHEENWLQQISHPISHPYSKGLQVLVLEEL